MTWFAQCYVVGYGGSRTLSDDYVIVLWRRIQDNYHDDVTELDSFQNVSKWLKWYVYLRPDSRPTNVNVDCESVTMKLLKATMPSVIDARPVCWSTKADYDRSVYSSNSAPLTVSISRAQGWPLPWHWPYALRNQPVM